MRLASKPGRKVFEVHLDQVNCDGVQLGEIGLVVGDREALGAQFLEEMFAAADPGNHRRLAASSRP